MTRKKERGKGFDFMGKKVYLVIALGNVHGDLDGSIFTENAITLICNCVGQIQVSIYLYV